MTPPPRPPLNPRPRPAGVPAFHDLAVEIVDYLLTSCDSVANLYDWTERRLEEGLVTPDRGC